MKDVIEIKEKDNILRTFILFAQTSRVVAKFQDAYLNKNAGISDVKLIVLMAFYYDPASPITASQLAQWTDTAPHNITTLINRMKQDGLLITERGQKDKRFLKVKITGKGRKTLKDSMAPAQEVIDRLMSSLSTEDILSLEKILKLIRFNAYEGIEALKEGK